MSFRIGLMSFLNFLSLFFHIERFSLFKFSLMEGIIQMFRFLFLLAFFRLFFRTRFLFRIIHHFTRFMEKSIVNFDASKGKYNNTYESSNNNNNFNSSKGRFSISRSRGNGPMGFLWLWDGLRLGLSLRDLLDCIIELGHSALHRIWKR